MSTGSIRSFNIFPKDHPCYLMQKQLDIIGNYEKTSKAPPPGMSIIFINGLLNGVLDSAVTAADISTQLNEYRISSEHNPGIGEFAPKTAMRLVKKILVESKRCEESLSQKLSSNECAQLVDKICIVIIAHSHGAVILDLAMKDKGLDSIRKSIRVVTAGGAALIPFPYHGYKSAENLINQYDVIPILAHNSFAELEKLSSIENGHSTLKAIVSAFIGIKKIFQESVLGMSSHNHLAALKILNAMTPGFERNPFFHPFFIYLTNETSKKVCEEAQIDKIATGNKNFDQTINLIAPLIIHVASELQFRVSILNPVNKPFELTTYLQDHHSLESYLPAIRPLVISYINEHQKAIDS
ncbi:MAG: hypothetical protein H7A40_03895 [Chlamydiales bacterium]|nr:hypothetical protein [Chlamydiales bacterium]